MKTPYIEIPAKSMCPQTLRCRQSTLGRPLALVEPWSKIHCIHAGTH